MFLNSFIQNNFEIVLFFSLIKATRFLFLHLGFDLIYGLYIDDRNRKQGSRLRFECFDSISIAVESFISHSQISINSIIGGESDSENWRLKEYGLLCCQSCELVAQSEVDVLVDVLVQKLIEVLFLLEFLVFYFILQLLLGLC